LPSTLLGCSKKENLETPCSETLAVTLHVDNFSLWSFSGVVPGCFFTDDLAAQVFYGWYQARMECFYPGRRSTT
jgi:hypothetical protein